MKNEQERAAELYEHRRDPNEWSEEAVAAEVRTSKTEVVSFRIPSDELDALEEAARTANESLSEYIRGAIVIKLHGTPIGPTVEIRSSGGTLVVQSHIVVGNRNENPAQVVSDFPPGQVAV